MIEKKSLQYRDFLPAQLARLHTLTQGVLASALLQCDLTIAHWRILICLTECGPSTLTGIVKFTHLPQSSLSRSVARLEERGAVTCVRDASDGRQLTIVITDVGRAMLDEAAPAVEARCGEAFSMSLVEMNLFKSTVGYLLSRLAPEPAVESHNGIELAEAVGA